MAAAAATAGWAARTRPVLRNGSFEHGLDGWTAAGAVRVVDRSGAAHAGEACVEADASAGVFSLGQAKLRVRRGATYRVRFWACGEGTASLELWGSERETDRARAAAWDRIPAEWTPYEAFVAPTRDGKLGIEWSGAGGRVRLDDVSVALVSLPVPRMLSDPAEFADEPSMVRSDDGSIHVAWNGHRDGADHVRVVWLRTAEGRLLETLGDWTAETGGRAVLGVRLVHDSLGRVSVLYAAEDPSGDWQVVVRRVDAHAGPPGPGPEVRVDRTSATDVKPAAAAAPEGLLVAWETNEGGERRIVAAHVRGETAGEPEPVSDPALPSYSPSVAALPDGTVAVAWHAFERGSSDVFVRRRSPAGRWGEILPVTRAPSLDRNPVLFARGAELWVAYESADCPGYRSGMTSTRRVHLARVGDSALDAPRGGSTISPLAVRAENVHAVADGSGRVWVAYLRPRPPQEGWETWLTCWTGAAWEPPLRVSATKGMDRRPSLVIDGTRGFVAFQADTLCTSWADIDTTAQATSTVHVTRIDLSGASPAAARPEFEPLRESPEPFEPAALRVAYGDDRAGGGAEHGGRSYRLLFGDLHEHTEISICDRVDDQSPDENFQSQRDIAGLDFAAATDHGENFVPALWHLAAKSARTHDDPGRFAPFLGQEWTSSFEEYSPQHPFGFYGHRNVVLADLRFPRWWNPRNRQTPSELWADLRAAGANFVTIPHQLADVGNVPVDWSFDDEVAQPVAEIFQVRGAYESRGGPRPAPRATRERGHFLQDAWEQGLVIGVVAAPDHGGGVGKAAVYATDFTREAILEALRARRCYGTTAARMRLDVRVDGHFMGEDVVGEEGAAPRGPVAIEIRADTPGEIDRVDILRRSEVLTTLRPASRTLSTTYVDASPLPGRSWYYVRVIQTDGEIGWTSPVWLGPRERRDAE